jgi:hypothetical protein
MGRGKQAKTEQKRRRKNNNKNRGERGEEETKKQEKEEAAGEAGATTVEPEGRMRRPGRKDSGGQKTGPRRARLRATRSHEPRGRQDERRTAELCLPVDGRGPRCRRGSTAGTARRARMALAPQSCRAAALFAKQQSGGRRHSRDWRPGVAPSSGNPITPLVTRSAAESMAAPAQSLDPVPSAHRCFGSLGSSAR